LSTTLAQAEEFALQQTCDHAGIRDGQSILELGCGWGSLSLWMAEKFPHARITAVSNSHSQREFIERRADQLGVNRNLKVITCDMNDFDIRTTFDRVVSVEMFEHMRNYRQLFANIAKWLTDDGRLFVHVFCHREFTYEFQDESASDWMSRYFFSGGVMPGDGLFARFADDLTICQQWRWSGMHYHLTSEAWLKNMDLRRDEVLRVLESTYGTSTARLWFQRWRVFFLAVSELFKLDGGQQWRVSHYLFGKTGKVQPTDVESLQVL
jgi:cyclopropane-fatty-acyl-phospholipid synthase